MTKQLYHGEYNWYGEVHKLWTRATSPAGAHRQFMSRLARLLEVTGYFVRCYYSKDKDNFKVTEKEKR